MNIVIAGIYRSGSTWLYNAVRLLYESQGLEVNGFFRGDGDWQEDKANIMKVHKFYPYIVDEADYIITSYRPYKDIVNSMKKQRELGLDSQFSNAGNHEDIAEFLSWLIEWNFYTCYCMEYETLIKNPTKIVRDLLFKLELFKANCGKVSKILSRMNPPEEGSDPITMLTSTHISGHNERNQSS